MATRSILAAAEVRQQGLDPEEHPEQYAAAMEQALARWKKVCEAEAKEVRAAGGLYVLGTERHEARRIDNQLRGRAGRQGDPGESRFYLSLQDELMRRFRASAVEAVMDRLNIPEDVPIESKMVSRQIKSAQTQIEAQNAEIRKNVLKYDEVLNQQRQVIYAERRRVLDGEDLRDQVRHMIEDVISDYVAGATAEGYAEDWDLEKLWSALKQLYPVGVTIEELLEEVGGEQSALEADQLRERLIEDAHAAYERREEELGAEVDAGDRAAGAAQRHRPEVAGAPLRDGLSQGGRGAARVRAAEPGRGVPARGLHDVPDHAGRHQGGVGPAGLPRGGADPGTGGDARGAAGDAPRGGEGAGAGSGTGHPDGRAAAVHPALLRTHDRRGRWRRRGRRAAGAGSQRRPRARAGRGPQVGARPTIGTTPGRRAGGRPSPVPPGRRQSAPGQVVGSSPSRNAPCPCGSGKKYKRCHGAPGNAS